MKLKIIIKRFLFFMLWICISGGTLMLLFAAVKRQSKELCSGIEITLNSDDDNFFIDRKEVEKLIASPNGPVTKGKRIAVVKLQQIENLLEKNPWVKSAEAWFDNQNLLHVAIVERVPIARIFTADGDSYYIDSNLKAMPLSENMNVKIPVFTGFVKANLLTTKDSLLLRGIKKIAQFINANSFWTSQIAQIEIAENGDFEMVPTIGKHVVKFGNAENAEKKFEKLFVFYQQVLSKTGFDQYSFIDVQLVNQIVGTKRGSATGAIDSVQWRKHIEQTMTEMRGDTVSTIENLLPQITTH